ncbi:MAG: hypothetical protein ABI609_13565 [Acidobacteriota bacterium]
MATPPPSSSAESPIECVLATIDQIYCWHARRAGFTLFGSHLGRLLLTDRRLAFLSSGNAGMARGLVENIVGGLPVQLLFGESRTDAIDWDGAAEVGGLNLVLPRIVGAEVKRRFDFSSYLSVAIHTAAGPSRHVAFMSRLGFDRFELLAFLDALERARRAS